MPTIEIALATRNGAKFLPAQLESLLAQTCRDFTILAADDGSTDGTREILAEFQRRHPGRMVFPVVEGPAGGARAGFSRLTDCLSADYAMFCDQDDVWLPDRVALSLREMRMAEDRFGRATPLLVQTDMTLVGPGLELRHASFWRSKWIDPRRHSLGQLLFENNTAGCSMTVNRALYSRARPIPPEAAMHDHWLALVAAAFGKKVYIDRSTVLFRRHDGNATGQTHWTPANALSRAREVLRGETLERDAASQRALCVQAGAFLARYGADLSPADRNCTAAMAGLPSAGNLSRHFAMLRHGLGRSNWILNAALFLMINRRFAPMPTGGGEPTRTGSPG